MVHKLARITQHAPSLVATLKQMNCFIRGAPYRTLKEHMRSYNMHWLRFNRDFYTVTVNSPKDYTHNPSLSFSKEKPVDDNIDLVLAELEVLLKNLHIPRKHWCRYLNAQLTIHEMLTQLCADLQSKNNIQVACILELINQQRAKNQTSIMSGGFLFTSFSMGLLFKFYLPQMMELIKIPITLPLIGSAYTLGLAGYRLYYNHNDTQSSFFNRVRDSSFILANSAVNLSAYALWIASGALMSPVVASLFVAASAVDVIKELFAAVQCYLHYKGNLLKQPNDLHGSQEQVRHEKGFIQHRNAALISIAAAVLLLGVMAVWSFVPGGLLLTGLCIAAIVVIHISKSRAQAYNKSLVRDNLQEELSTLEKVYGDSSQHDADDELDTGQELQTKTTTIIPLPTEKPTCRGGLFFKTSSQKIMPKPLRDAAYTEHVSEAENLDYAALHQGLYL